MDAGAALAYGARAAARHDCCLNGTVALQVRPGFGRIAATLVPRAGWVGQWPSAWLGGLGTPWNTLQLGGAVRLAIAGRDVESVAGPLAPRRPGRPRRSTRLVAPDHARHARQLPHDAQRRRRRRRRRRCLTLTTAGRPAAADRHRHLGPRRRAASAARRGPAPADEAALSNLLNIIGRRDGARSDHFDRMSMTRAPLRASRATWLRKAAPRRSRRRLLLGSLPCGAGARPDARARRAFAASR